MAKTGFTNGSGQKVTRPQQIKVVPASTPAPQAQPSGPSKAAAAGGFLKNHLRKILLAAALSPAVVGLVQSDIEHPEHDALSIRGVADRYDRISHNYSSIIGGAWNLATSPIRGGLHATNSVNTGLQPLDYAVVCINKNLQDKMDQGDSRAQAFRQTVMPQFDAALRQLGYQNAVFYSNNAHIDPTGKAPAAVFHIEDVPAGWDPHRPYRIDKPYAVEQSYAASPSVCGTNEIYKQIKIPTIKVN
ncbi:MAG: hypothetical protein ACK4NR_05845 [Micavibrio sp.]